MPDTDGGSDDNDAIDGFSVGIDGEVSRSVTSASDALRSMKTSQSSSAVRRRAVSRGNGGCARARADGPSSSV